MKDMEFDSYVVRAQFEQLQTALQHTAQIYGRPPNLQAPKYHLV